MSVSSYLRELIAQPGLLVAPGAYDALSARLIAKAGFPAVYGSGFCAAASKLGLPDIGLIHMPEMAAHCRQLVQATDRVPVIADADTGYGDPVTIVMRTIPEYIAAGVAAIQLEDQVWPKRCGHMAGKQVIPMEEMVAKIHAAIAARRDSELVIIGRTDANAVCGIEEAIRRGKAYQEAGADMILIESPTSLEEIQAITNAFPDIPLVYNLVESGRMPQLTLKEIEEFGFKLVIYSVSILFTVAHTLLKALQTLQEGNTSASFRDQMVTFSEFTSLVGLPAIQEIEQHFNADEPTRALVSIF